MEQTNKSRMAGLAYLRAVSFREETELRDAPRRPKRVSSASLIDRMNTIPEDGIKLFSLFK